MSWAESMESNPEPFMAGNRPLVCECRVIEGKFPIKWQQNVRLPAQDQQVGKVGVVTKTRVKICITVHLYWVQAVVDRRAIFLLLFDFQDSRGNDAGDNNRPASKRVAS